MYYQDFIYGSRVKECRSVKPLNFKILLRLYIQLKDYENVSRYILCSIWGFKKS